MKPRFLLMLATTLSLTIAAPAAFAGVAVGVYVPPRPVYIAPAPVVVRAAYVPPPVVIARPPVVVRPVYYHAGYYGPHVGVVVR
jgi:hypothetical protein